MAADPQCLIIGALPDFPRRVHAVNPAEKERIMNVPRIISIISIVFSVVDFKGF